MCKQTVSPPFCDGAHAKLLSDGKKTSMSVESSSTVSSTKEEPTLQQIHELARDGLSKVGHHGEMGSMGVPRQTLPQWDDIQILTAQFDTKPLLENISVGTELVIGPNAKKPLGFRSHHKTRHKRNLWSVLLTVVDNHR